MKKITKGIVISVATAVLAACILFFRRSINTGWNSFNRRSQQSAAILYGIKSKHRINGAFCFILKKQNHSRNIHLPEWLYLLYTLN